MNTQSLIILFAFAGAAWYLWQSNRPTTWTPVQLQPPGAQQGSGRITLPGMPNAGQTLLGAGASGFSAGLAGGPIVAGIMAAASTIGAAITQLGVFRGGEEGVKVNPARDEFKKQFVPFNPYRTQPIPDRGRVTNSEGEAGFYGYAWLMNQLGRDDITRLFNSADTMKELEFAINETAGVIAINSTKVQQLAEYAKATF